MIRFSALGSRLSADARRIAFLVLFGAAVAPSALQAQQPHELVRQLSRSGPRFGVTWLSGAVVDTLERRLEFDIAPVITQFGWQYERQFASLENGPVALNEWILLVGGLDQDRKSVVEGM